MAEYWAFLNRLRQDLGKSYTVAEEHTANPRQIRLVVRRQRQDETLAVVTDTRWLTLLAHGQSAEAWDDYKRLATLIGGFFANPAALPPRAFEWPGSAQSRDELYQLLGRRRRAPTA